MKNKINYDSDEVVILKNERVMYSNSMAGYKDTLILTNKRIIYVKKGIFGGDKEIKSYLLSSIKIYKERAQVMLSRTDDFKNKLEIFFISENVIFGFENKKDVILWIKKINELTTGKELSDEEIDDSDPFKDGMKKVAKTLKDTIDIYRDTFGIKKKEEHVSCKCENCGAALFGIKGENIKCTYCGNIVTLK